MVETLKTSRKPSPVSAILVAWLVAGTMDITAACTKYYIDRGKGPGGVLRYVASGILGRPALKGGNAEATWGLLFHYGIALIWTLLFFWIYPKIPILSKNKVVTGLLYGLFVWVMMSQVVVPLSAAPAIPFVLKSAVIAAAILMVCIGLPIALIIGNYYQRSGMRDT